MHPIQTMHTIQEIQATQAQEMRRIQKIQTMHTIQEIQVTQVQEMHPIQTIHQTAIIQIIAQICPRIHPLILQTAINNRGCYICSGLT